MYDFAIGVYSSALFLRIRYHAAIASSATISTMSKELNIDSLTISGTLSLSNGTSGILMAFGCEASAVYKIKKQKKNWKKETIN